MAFRNPDDIQINFRKKLMLISEELSEDDLSTMLFLCSEFLTRQEVDNVKTGIDFFQLLEERNKLGPKNVYLLADLLREVDQISLLDHIEDISPSAVRKPNQRCQIKYERLYLMKIGSELDSSDFLSLKAACGCNKEEITQYDQLITYLEHRKLISVRHKVDVEFLLNALKKAGLLKDEKSRLFSITEEFKKSLEIEEACYKLTSDPKGICVIINNVHFQNPQKNRRGSNYDRDLLTRLFKIFRYEVINFEDLKSSDIVSKLREISSRDHWLSDIFVCCVLSHGSLGSVFGVDDVAVKIQTILDLFSVRNCPSLAEKPKVFFFQACQGTNFQSGSSFSLEQGLQVERGQVCQASTHTVSDTIIDEEAPSKSELQPDLLLGYATPPGYKSYRDETKGSWYINELVDSLFRFAATEDILTILTKVNSDVAQKTGTDGSCFVKQTPCPTFTLRKKLYLATKEDMKRL